MLGGLSRPFLTLLFSQSFQNFSWQRRYYTMNGGARCGDATMCGVPFHLIPLEAFPSKSWHQRSFNALCNLFSIVTQGSELAKKWVTLVKWFNVWSRDHCAIVIQYVLANPSFLFLCISLLPLKSESNVNVQYELLYTVLNPTFILLLLLTFNPQSRKR